MALRRNLKSDYLHLISRCNALLENAALGYIEAGQIQWAINSAGRVATELIETCKTEPERLAGMRLLYMDLSNKILYIERKHLWGWNSPN